MAWTLKVKLQCIQNFSKTIYMVVDLLKKTTSLHLPIQKNPLYHGHSKVNTLPETCHPIFSLITIDLGKVVERPIIALSLSFPWL